MAGFVNKSTYKSCKHLTCTVGTLQETIQKYGVAIVAGVLNQAECDAMSDGLDTWLEQFPRYDKNRPEKWRISDLAPVQSMIYQGHEIGQCQMVWDVRQNPKIVSIFESFYNVKDPKDLLVSFDGVGFLFPGKKIWNQSEYGNFHVDQGYLEPGFRTLQSWVTAFDVNEGDATITVFEKSNQWHSIMKEVFHKNDTRNKHFNVLEPDQLKYLVQNGCHPISITCKKGDMVFWDSRTVHAGTKPFEWRSSPNKRLVVYVCYAPIPPRDVNENKEKYLQRKQQIKQKKIERFEARRMTTHHPIRGNLFPRIPRHATIRVYKRQDPILTPLGRRLVGYDDDDDDYTK